MIPSFPFSTVHLVGIKGVAMTSLAQVLVDAGYTVTGSDVPDDFVTATQLRKLPVKIQNTFTAELPANTQAVVYTAAHQADQNPQVQLALAQAIPTFTQAEAISFFANSKELLAVCGVGGKSTVSAMITWILEWNHRQPSFSVGVGTINGLNKTGAWRPEGKQFVIEADEYVTNPLAVQQGTAGTPRFAYLKPACIVATNVAFDHPDVYRDFEHTKKTFAGFFSKLSRNGTLVVTQQVLDAAVPLPNCSIVTVSTTNTATFRYQYLPEQSKAGTSYARLIVSHTTYTVQLQLPGEYNMQNAVCAIAAAASVGISVADAIAALAEFTSTQRRFEKRLTLGDTEFYDDYAHHPNELRAVITALKEWYPEKDVIIAFQPHTFSRTRSLLQEFAESLSTADTVILLDIFASAREADDPTMSSAVLAERIRAVAPKTLVQVIPDTQALAEYFTHKLPGNSVVLTTGAGDIYQVYDHLSNAL